MRDKWGMVRRHCVNDKELRFWQRYAAETGMRSLKPAFYVAITDREGTIGGLCVYGVDVPDTLPIDDRLLSRYAKRIKRLRVKWMA